MQAVQSTAPEIAAPIRATTTAATSAAANSAYAGYQIIRRNGAVVSFEPNKIAVALMKDRKSTRLNSSHIQKSRMPSSA